MKFEFDTVNDGAKEAAALVTALAILHGEGVLDAIDKASDKLDPKAPDGYPADGLTTMQQVADTASQVAETSAADAFGEQPVMTVGFTGTLDKDGIPWDERIHASTKTTNKDGTWTRRRNTPDATFDAVMAELKDRTARQAVGWQSETPPSPPAPPAPPALPIAEAAPVSPVPSPPATETPAAPNTSTPVASPTSASALTFPQIMVKVTKAQGAGKITKPEVEGYLGSFGLAAMKDLASADKDTLAAFDALIDGHIDG